MELPGHTFETGAICNALACHGVKAPHTRKPYSEALLLGVSGGIAFGYMVFQYKGWPAHVALLTRNTFSPYRTVIDRLGIVEDTKETVDPKRGLANLIEAIENGSPTIVWADVLSLPYTNVAANQNMWAVMPMVVHSFDGASFHLADRSKVSWKVSADVLTAARARVKKDRFRIATLSPPDANKLPAAVEAGIRQCIDLFDGVGAPRGHGENFGFAGLQKWAEMLVNKRNKQSWARVFPTGADIFQALAGRQVQPGIFIWIMTWGAGPDGERGIFADFLEDAALILNESRLSSVASQFRKSAALWHSLAETALPSSIPLLRETGELLLRQRAILIDKGPASADERREIGARLVEIAKTAAEALDPSSAALQQMLEELRDRVLAIESAERSGINELKKIACAK
jgi:hypothetical protein